MKKNNQKNKIRCCLNCKNWQVRKQYNFLNLQFADGYCHASSDWAITDKNFRCGKFEITDALKAENDVCFSFCISSI